MIAVSVIVWSPSDRPSREARRFGVESDWLDWIEAPSSDKEKVALDVVLPNSCMEVPGREIQRERGAEKGERQTMPGDGEGCAIA